VDTGRYFLGLCICTGISLTVVVGGNLSDCNAFPAETLPMHVGKTERLGGTEAGKTPLLDLAPNDSLLVWPAEEGLGERTVRREADVKDAVLALRDRPNATSCHACHRSARRC
jgi:hypothetical protein